MPSPLTCVDPYTLQGKSLPVHLNWRYFATSIGKITTHVFILQTCKHSHDGGVITNLVCHHFDQWELWLGLIVEWIRRSNFLCKSHCWCGHLSELAITWDWGPVYRVMCSGLTHLEMINPRLRGKNESESKPKTKMSQNWRLNKQFL